MAGAPRWLIAAIVVALLVPILLSHRGGSHSVSHFLGYVLNCIVTVALIFAVYSLLAEVTAHTMAMQ